MNTVDATARGIKDGDDVRVFNDRGMLILPARVTERIMPGVVDIPEGAWPKLDKKGVDRGGCANFLVRDHPLIKEALPSNTCLVEVEPAGELTRYTLSIEEQGGITMATASPVWSYPDPYEYMMRVIKHDWPPLIVTVAISGAGGKEVNPNFPEQPDEQARQTYEAYHAGASIVHVHARDKTAPRLPPTRPVTVK